jgi:hypothetical protein
MSTIVGVRFRPVSPRSGKDGGDPLAEARARWSSKLSSNPNVLSFAFGPQPAAAVPLERPTAATATSPPVDLTIEWTSLEAANALIGNKEEFINLCGIVACAPATRVAGQETIQLQP